MAMTLPTLTVMAPAVAVIMRPPALRFLYAQYSVSMRRIWLYAQDILAHRLENCSIDVSLLRIGRLYATKRTRGKAHS